MKVRVIAATNADLESLMAHGLFREDLYYRLGVVRLQLPPLRARRDEILTLARRFLRRHAAQYDKGRLRLAEATEECLLLYRWPGNVRQLGNEMKRVAALARKDVVVLPADLSPDIGSPSTGNDQADKASEHTRIALDQPMAAAVERLERAQLEHALRACGGNAGKAATRLGLSRKGLYLKRRRYGIGTSHETDRRAGRRRRPMDGSDCP